MQTVVGGGTGFIGHQLVTYLQRLGHSVTVVSRKPGPGRINWIQLNDEGLPHGTEAVINVCGQNVLDPTRRWTEGFKQNVYASRVNTNKLFAKAITRARDKPKVFVAISGVGCYQPSPTTVYTEESATSEFDFLSLLVRRWEAAAQLPDTVPTRNVWIRSGVVLGRRGGMVQQLLLPFLFGVGGRMGSGTQPMPWIHVKDLSRLIIHAMETPEVTGVLNGVAPEMVTNQEFVKAFAKTMRRPAVIPLPEFALDLVFNKERAALITKGQKVYPERVLQSGFEYFYPTVQEACDECAHFVYDDPDDYVTDDDERSSTASKESGQKK